MAWTGDTAGDAESDAAGEAAAPTIRMDCID